MLLVPTHNTTHLHKFELCSTIANSGYDFRTLCGCKSFCAKKTSHYSFLFRVSVALDFQTNAVISLKQPSLQVRPHQAQTDTGAAAPRRTPVNLPAHLSVYLSERKQSFSTVNHRTGQIHQNQREIWHQASSLSVRGVCVVNENTGSTSQSF